MCRIIEFAAAYTLITGQSTGSRSCPLAFLNEGETSAELPCE
jgi:hypothetical protein